jgi:hypothetical protein
MYDWDIEPDMSYMIGINASLWGGYPITLQQLALDWLLAEPAGVGRYLTFNLSVRGN